MLQGPYAHLVGYTYGTLNGKVIVLGVHGLGCCSQSSCVYLSLILDTLHNVPGELLVFVVDMTFPLAEGLN